ncbi:MAG: 2-dehydropantoate 2-reductase [Anaerolineales bacterium]|nr:2-dehydropantoate 2-reductase [Anaerolineales bacterium]
MNNQPLLILGTGALATLFAARLSAQGHDVTILGTWEAGLDALERDGARLIDSNGRESVQRVRVIRDPKRVTGIRFAFVLLKAWQTERAARQLAECLAPDGLAVTLQNGLGNDDMLAQSLGRERVALGVTTTGATLLAPGLARAGGEGVVSLEAHPRMGDVESMLRSARFTVEVVADAKSLVWGKLVINAAINPLTALLRVSNGELLNRPSARELMRALAEETAAVASAQNIRLPFANPVEAAETVAHKTAENHSSMLQDVLRGAPTEIDAICGAVTRIGEEHGVATPVNRACWQLVRAVADGGEGAVVRFT